MYVPPAFAQTDPAVLRDFLDRYGFGLLISQHDGEPFATHLPFLYDPADGPHGTLFGHLARANPQWHGLPGRTALAVFSGPHAYVSPTWYEADHMVPTWNYTAVHAYGVAEVVEDPTELGEIVRRTTAFYESAMPEPWVVPAGGPFVERLLAQIVGVRIRVERLEGKWKLNQNHPAERREKVTRALDAQGDDNARGVAEWMRRT